MILLHYITKFHYSRLFYIIISLLSIYYFSLVLLLLFSFYFHFWSCIIFTYVSNSTWCVALAVLSYICGIAFIIILLLFFPWDLCAKNVGYTKSFIIFIYIYSHIDLYMKTCFNYLLLLFIGKCFKLYFVNLYKLYSIAVFICYLHFVTYSTVHNVFRTLWQVSFLVKFVACGLELGEK